ncbi:hypothetical protein GCM10010254_13170 [Streptomyces chromofuscus]|nr:hypothetical protein GCM10010254_13170 [Streptomyces chromofuscus]
MRRAVRDLHPRARPAAQQQRAAPVRDMAHDVGDQLRHAELHRVGQVRHPPLRRQRADDAADVPWRVFAHGRAHAVLGGARDQVGRGEVFVHATRPARRTYCGRRIGYNPSGSAELRERGPCVTRINDLDPGASPAPW